LAAYNASLASVAVARRCCYSGLGTRGPPIPRSGQWAILPPSMKRRTRLLKQAALESVTLSIEVFNRPSATARTQGVLLNLQHSFEMLFKEAIELNVEDRARVRAGSRRRPHDDRRGLVDPARLREL
jgi:hypothetical protein